MKSKLAAVGFLSILMIALSTTTEAQDANMRKPSSAILSDIIGTWEGTCKTWFRPGQLADESKISGEFTSMYGGGYVRYTYNSTLKGKPYTGENTIAHDPVEDVYQSAWFDTFHMNYALLISLGEKIDNGFAVSGKYRMSKGQKFWGWRTEFVMTDRDNLVITSYNITPDGQEGKAVEVTYVRKG